MSRTTVIINFSAPPDLAKMIVRQAKRERKTKSELLRNAFNPIYSNFAKTVAYQATDEAKQ